MNIRSDDLLWRDDFDSVYVLQDLWSEAPAFLAQLAPDAPITKVLDYGISFSDPLAFDCLRLELAAHLTLCYAAADLEDD